MKNRKLENWLIADPEALRQMPARFQVTQAFIQSVSPDKADHVADAEKTLNSL